MIEKNVGCRSVVFAFLFSATGITSSACDGGSRGYQDDYDSETSTGEGNCFDGSYTITGEEGVEFMEQYDCITGDLTVTDSQLTSLDLPNLIWVGGDLTVCGNGFLENLEMHALKFVEGEMLVYINPAFVGFSMSSLSSLGGLMIEDTTTLTNLEGLSNIETIDGYLIIRVNQALETLGGLEKITSLEMLAVSDNPLLKNLDALGSLTEIAGEIEILGNESLTSIRLNEVNSVGGNLPFSRSTKGIAVKGPYDEPLEIGYNVVLETLEMKVLTSVGGRILIEGNTVLEDFDLNNLAAAGGYLEINENSALTGLGLSNLTTLGCFSEQGICFAAVDNTELPQCEACNLLEQLEGFDEDFEFQGNKPDECAEDCQ